MPTCVRSYSKINLGLAIGPVRGDGFHGLTTLYQTLEAHDLVTVAVERLGTAERWGAGAENRIALTSNDRRVPVDARNTVWKMLERVLAAGPFGTAGAGGGWAISVHIEKRLPVQGGLGAGSANAAAALVGLERETGLALDGEARLRIAAEVGSDVPLFLLGGAVLGLGRGEQVVPVPDLTPEGMPVEVVLAMPEVGVSTPQAFRDWDEAVADSAVGASASGPGVSGPYASGRVALTAAAPSDRLGELSRALASAFCEPRPSSGVFPQYQWEGLAGHTLSALVRTGIRNDFEEVVFRQHPFLGTIKRALLGLHGSPSGETAFREKRSARASSTSAVYAALSGSGSTLFGLYADGAGAEAAEERLAALGVRTLRTRLLGRARYWREMFAG